MRGWFVFSPLLPMFVLFFISALAENQPASLRSAGGGNPSWSPVFAVEYSSTPYLLFMVAEYLNIVLMCAMMSILFFGGWLPPIDIWPINAVPGVIWLIIKVWFFFFLFAMAKAIVPRYRYDQLMRLGWKVFSADFSGVGGARKRLFARDGPASRVR